MRTRYRVISGALLLLPALLIGGTRLATTRALAEDPAGRLTPEAEERLLADLERLHALGIFAGEGTERDAAPFLNPRIKWDRLEQAVGATPASWATDDYESLSRTVTKYSKGVGWLDHPEVTSGYDVSFLADLAHYDHWDWQASDPYLAHYKENPDESGIISPLPNFIPFNRIARVRLAQGYTNGDLPAAMREVEQLAMLVGSTDTLIGAMVATAILKSEQQVYDRALTEGRIAPDPRHRWTATDVETLKHATKASTAVFEGAASPEFAVRLAAHDELPGVCAGLAEAINLTMLTRDVAESRWPGELDLSASAKAISGSLAVSPCQIPHARAVWARPELSAMWRNGISEVMRHDDVLREPWEQVMSLPYLRQPALAQVLVVVAPNFSGPYGG